MIYASAPGTALLSGKYAVLDGAPAIATAVSRRVRIALSETSNDYHSLSAPGYVNGQWNFWPNKGGDLPGADCHGVAAAAVGCVPIRCAALVKIGGFASLCDSLISDCTLAAKVKEAGWPIHIALSHDVSSVRSYSRLAELWWLVSRTAYSQLGHPPIRPVLCTLIMLALFVSPVLTLFAGEQDLQWGSAVAYFAMTLTQVPVLVYNDLHPLRALVLPLVSILFFLMTWNSAWRYW